MVDLGRLATAGVAAFLVVASGSAGALTVEDDGTSDGNTTDLSETVECPSVTNASTCQASVDLVVDVDQNGTDEANATASGDVTGEAPQNDTRETGAAASADCEAGANGTPCEAAGDVDPDPQASEEVSISVGGVEIGVGLDVACALEVPDAPCEVGHNATANADVSLSDVLPGACFWNLCLF